MNVSLEEEVAFPCTKIPVELVICVHTKQRNGVPAILYDKEKLSSGEPQIQLLEGCEYEYSLSVPEYRLDCTGRLRNIIFPNKIRVNKSNDSGRIRTGLNVGILDLVLLDVNGNVADRLPIEVRSEKIGYRDDYRVMLEFITNRCIDLLTRIRSPASGLMMPDPGNDPKTIGQRFAFLQSIIGSQEFTDALERITQLPHESLERIFKKVPSSRGFRPSSYAAKRIACSSRRTQLVKSHPMAEKFDSFPEYIRLPHKCITTDTPENRFIKFALQNFLFFLKKMNHKLKSLGEADNSILRREIGNLETQLESTISKPFFREISDPYVLPLQSPILQKKDGYREVFHAWIYFYAAASLVWDGGDDVYHAGRRDIATLYEYWAFFKLLDIVADVFDLSVHPCEDLIEETKDGFGLKLKIGRHIAIEGTYTKEESILNVRFSYNKTFSRARGIEDSEGLKTYPSGGSWTERLRPDYTLSLWPQPFTENEAEKQELIIHVHFDAKYRVDNITDLFGRDDSNLSGEELNEELTEEKKSQQQGKYERADLLKMHAYRDAIRRTAGAYILYPGQKSYNLLGFHEILPGLGAFPMRPVSGNDSDSEEIKKFIKKIVEHISDRATHRESQTYHLARIHNISKASSVFRDLSITSKDGQIRHTPPQETFVLVVSYKDGKELEWTKQNNLVIVNLEDECGELKLSTEIIGAQYVLMCLSEVSSSKMEIMRVKYNDEGQVREPAILSASKLSVEYKFPSSLNSAFYLTFEVENTLPFNNFQCDLKELRKIDPRFERRVPFSMTLDKLLSMANQGSRP